VILVTAAGGRTGRSVVPALSGTGEPVRAFDIVPAVTELAGDAGVEAAVGDMRDASQVRRAMDGVRVVVHIGPPLHPDEAAMGHVVVSEARRSGVEHFVQFSVTHPQLEPLLNHQAKLAVERHLLLSRMPFTILQPMHYMQNVDIEKAVSTGVLRQPYSVDARLAHVDLDDVATIAAQVVTKGEAHYYATYELCGSDYRSARELAEVITSVSGRTVTAEAVGQEGDPIVTLGSSEEDDYRADALRRLFGHYGRYGITGNPNVLTWLLGRRPTTFGEYVRRGLANRGRTNDS